ncbi:MAG: glutamine-hydrolyzing GMP synthase, partial [Patescibacteria group bacterium]
MAIVVLNFGGQFAHLIARRVRDLGVKAEILHGDAGIREIQAYNPAGIIMSGSPHSVLEKGPLPDKKIFELEVPVLGICYGHQAMAHILPGGKVSPGREREFGKEILSVKNKGKLFKGLASKEVVWFSHGDQVSVLPKGFTVLASTKSCKYAGFSYEKGNFYGIQFHPEVTHTLSGRKILSNFLFGICRAKKDWNMKSVPLAIIKEIRETVGEKHVVVGISGGVDSLVAAT